MEFWSYDDDDELFDDENDGDNENNIDEAYVQMFSAWFELKKRSGEDFTYEASRKLRNC